MSEPLPPPSANASAEPTTAYGSAVGGDDASALPPPSAELAPSVAEPERSGRAGRVALIVVGVLALALIAVGIVVAVAGGTTDDSFSLATALDEASDATTAEYEMTVTVGTNAPVKMSAAVDSEAELIGMEISADALLGEIPGFGSDAASIEMIFDGENGVVYMSADALDGLGEVFVFDARWLAFDLETLGPLGAGAEDELVDDWSEALGQAPFAALDQVLSSQDAEEIGPETIDGEETMRYHVAVDETDVLAGFPAVGTMTDQLEEMFGVPIGDEADLEELLGDEVAELGYDVWVTEDNQLRRLSVSMTVLGETMTATVDLFNLGEDLDLAVPPEDEVFDLGELLGG